MENVSAKRPGESQVLCSTVSWRINAHVTFALPKVRFETRAKIVAMSASGALFASDKIFEGFAFSDDAPLVAIHHHLSGPGS